MMGSIQVEMDMNSYCEISLNSQVFVRRLWGKSGCEWDVSGV